MSQQAPRAKTHYDRSLERRVLSFLAAREVEIENFRIEANRGVTTLKGELRSLAEKRRCASLVHRVAGVTKVLDRLVVREAAKQPLGELGPKLRPV